MAHPRPAPPVSSAAAHHGAHPPAPPHALPLPCRYTEVDTVKLAVDKILLLDFVSSSADLETDKPGKPALLIAVAMDGTVIVFDPRRFPVCERFKTRLALATSAGSLIAGKEPVPIAPTCMAYAQDRTMFAVGTEAGGLRLSPGLPVRLVSPSSSILSL